jgi:hypothetical protein
MHFEFSEGMNTDRSPARDTKDEANGSVGYVTPRPTPGILGP